MLHAVTLCYIKLRPNHIKVYYVLQEKETFNIQILSRMKHVNVVFKQLGPTNLVVAG